MSRLRWFDAYVLEALPLLLLRTGFGAGAMLTPSIKMSVYAFTKAEVLNLPFGSYQAPIELTAPPNANATRRMSHGFIVPSATPSAIRLRRLRSIRRFNLRTSLRAAGASSLSSRLTTHWPNSIVVID